MLLTIDVGNTNTVFVIFKDDQPTGEWRCETRPSDYEVILQEIGVVDGIVITSVVPRVNGPLGDFCQQYLQCCPVFVTKDNVGIQIDAGIDNPEDIGADRLVNAVAVLKHYQAPAIVIDFGTATTFDVIDGQGCYAGGVIAPGINLSLRALEKAAAKLPDIEIKKPVQAIGKDTKTAMQSGIYYGYKGLIEGVLVNISEEMGVDPFVIATGGLSSLFADNLGVIDEVDQTLTMKGLLQIYKNHKNEAAA